ncbi:hypothetical protein DRN52_09015 [Thermococci archaeon]|nr:MAG: hypothetical protein DRN52_09015 [Thermococci archaeon]
MKYRCGICGVYFGSIFDIMEHLQLRHYVKVEFGDYIEAVGDTHDEPSLLSKIDPKNIRCEICGRKVNLLSDDWILYYRDRKFYHKKCLESRERSK